MAYYLDTSALTKLVVAEPESTSLRRWLTAPDRQPVSSDLARTELLRAVRRAAPDRMTQARAVLAGIPDGEYDFTEYADEDAAVEHGQVPDAAIAHPGPDHVEILIGRRLLDAGIGGEHEAGRFAAGVLLDQERLGGTD